MSHVRTAVFRCLHFPLGSVRASDAISITYERKSETMGRVLGLLLILGFLALLFRQPITGPLKGQSHEKDIFLVCHKF